MSCGAIADTGALLDEFAEAVAAGVSAWVRAGEILARVVEEDGERAARAALLERCGVSGDTFTCFLRLGRREIVPEVLLGGAWGPAAAALPYDEQRRLVDAGAVDVAVWDGSRCAVERLPLGELSPAQCRRAFADGRVVPPREQAAAIEAEAARRTKPRGRPRKVATAKAVMPKAASDPSPPPAVELPADGHLAEALHHLVEARAKLGGAHDAELTGAVNATSRVLREVRVASAAAVKLS